MNKKLIPSILLSSMAFGLSASEDVAAEAGKEVAKQAGKIAKYLVIPAKATAKATANGALTAADYTVGFAGYQAKTAGSYLAGKTVDLGKASFAASKTAGTWSWDSLKSAVSKTVEIATPVVTDELFVGSVVCVGLGYVAYKVAQKRAAITAQAKALYKSAKEHSTITACTATAATVAAVGAGVVRYAK